MHEKATHQQTRTYNRQFVLRTIFDHSAISRADIARLTHLTPVTVSEIVAELITDKLVAESAPNTVVEGETATIARRGRRPILVQVAAGERQILALRLAVHEFRGVILDLNGEFRYSKQLPVDDVRGDAAVARVLELVDDLVAHADRPILGIGIASPGIVDTYRGVVLRSVFFQWDDLPLADRVHQRCGLPVHIANASQVTALAEHLFGSDRTLRNLAVVRIGQDVGAGFIVDGQLFFGDGFGAGEIGHIAMQEHGDICACGNRGCLETLVSTPVVIRAAQRAAAEHPTSILARHLAAAASPGLDAVLAAYAEGDPWAQEIAQTNATTVGHALAFIVALLNIQRILLVGSVTQFGDAWLQQVRDALPRAAIPNLAQQTNVEIAQHGPNAIILGAAALLLSRELGLTLLRTSIPHE